MRNHNSARYPIGQTAEELSMSAAVPFPPKLPRKPSSIFIPEHDPEGHPIESWLRDLAYAKQSELASYRQTEMPDDAQVTSLIELAVYRTSKAIAQREITDPTRYLFRIYRNSVDSAIRKTVKAFGMEPEILAQIATSSSRTEDELLKTLTCKKVIDAMDEKGRALWNKHLLGYDLDELAAEEGQSTDYLGQRLRRAIERALRRLQRENPSA